MNLNDFAVMLAQLTTPDPRAGTVMGIVWVAVMIAMVYFMMIQPQRKRSKELAALMKGLRPGDKIVTNSGIVGVIVTVRDDSISLRSEDAKLEILKSTVAEVKKRAGDTAQA